MIYQMCHQDQIIVLCLIKYVGSVFFYVNVRGRRRSDSMQQMKNIYNNNNNNRKLISLIFFFYLSPYFPFHSNDQQVGFLLYNSGLFFLLQKLFLQMTLFLVQQSKWQISKIYIYFLFNLSFSIAFIHSYATVKSNKQKIWHDKRNVVVCVLEYKEHCLENHWEMMIHRNPLTWKGVKQNQQQHI